MVSVEKMELACPALGLPLQVGNKNTEQLLEKTTVTIGIRAENIAVTADDSADRDVIAPNQLICIVKQVHPKRNGVLLLLKPLRGTTADFLEVDVTTGMLGQETKAAVGQRLRVSLSPEQIFLFAD
ncbi:MAG: hypothetical protein H6Q66_1441 [Firmicutes bacterium]|nr:hypothetical protein [Bacillota bacterium]